jgi:hypothetical protein
MSFAEIQGQALALDEQHRARRRSEPRPYHPKVVGRLNDSVLLESAMRQERRTLSC